MISDWLLILGGILLIILGTLGCILPILPGLPVSFLGILLIHRSRLIHLSSPLLVVLAICIIVVSILDYIIPQLGTKRRGGTKFGIRGATLGLFIGIWILPPVGIIVGPILGAGIAEYIVSQNIRHSLRAAKGAFIGFLGSIGIKLIVSLRILGYAIFAVLSAV